MIDFETPEKFEKYSRKWLLRKKIEGWLSPSNWIRVGPKQENSMENFM
jgi:hypothetical protein